MKPDRTLPQTDDELRDWLAEAWKDGWRSRASMIGKPMGTVEHEKPRLLDTFLASWDLPPLPKPTPTPIRDAIQRMSEEKP